MSVRFGSEKISFWHPPQTALALGPSFLSGSAGAGAGGCGLGVGISSMGRTSKAGEFDVVTVVVQMTSGLRLFLAFWIIMNVTAMAHRHVQRARTTVVRRIRPVSRVERNSMVIIFVYKRCRCVYIFP